MRRRGSAFCVLALLSGLLGVPVSEAGAQDPSSPQRPETPATDGETAVPEIDEGLPPDDGLGGPGLGEAVQELSLLDLIGPDGTYTLKDGGREFPLRLLDEGDAAALGGGHLAAGSAASAYAPAPGADSNATQATELARPSNWLVSDTGQLYLLVGGVNVVFEPHLSRSDIAAILDRHAIAPESVSPLGELPNGYLVKTVSDAESLRLADALSSEPGVHSAGPNMFTPFSVGPEPMSVSPYRRATAAARQRCNLYTDPYPDELSSCLWYFDASTSFQMTGSPVHIGNPTFDINLGDVWSTTMGAGVTVAVVDGTWEPTHEDLKDNVDTQRSTAWGGFTSENPNAEAPYHGTAVAGVIAARDNSVGGRGVAPRATLVNYNLLDDFSLAREAEALTLNAATVAVANHSYGITARDGLGRAGSLWSRALETSLSTGFGGKGTSHVQAAGNGKGHSVYGGSDWATLDEANNARGIVAVCAVDSHGRSTWYSEEGPSLWVCAPSRNSSGQAAILTTVGSSGYYDRFSGTSAAAPLVSGVVALMRAANANLTWRDVKVILANTAQKNDASDSGWQNGATKYGSDTETYWFNNKYGFGVVDAKAAVNAASRWTLLPAMQTAAASSNSAVSLPTTGNEVVLTLDIQTPIDFVEHVKVTVNGDVYDIRDYRVTLVSPSGIESLLSPQYTDCRRGRCSLWGSFDFGSSRHLGEDPSGAWKLKFRRYAPQVACGNDSTSFNSACNDIASFTERILSWRIDVTGHSSLSTQPVTLSTVSSSVAEGAEVGVTVAVGGTAPTQDLTIPLVLTAGSATAAGSTGADYATLASITVPAGASSATAKIATTQDDVYEADETFTVGLGALPQGYTAASGPVTVTITDDESPPTVTLQAGSSSIAEGEATAIGARLSGKSQADVTVDLSISPEAPAVAGDATLSAPHTITVPGGATSSSGTATFTASQNDVYELTGSTAKAFTVSGTVTSGDGVADPAAITIAISDDESTPEISITAGDDVTEGGAATFTLTASPIPSADLSVSVTVSQDGDFGAQTGSRTVTIPTGGSATLTIATAGDSTDEPDGSVTVTVAPGTDYTPPSPSSASITVADDDAPSSYTVDPQLIADVRSYAAEPHGHDHVRRWKRVLLALGDNVDMTGYSGGPTTLAEARQLAAIHIPARWNPVVAALEALEAASQTPVTPPPVTPEVSISAGNGVTEGADASFTLSASPEPTADLVVTVTVTTAGDHGVAAGPRTVTIPTGGSATLTIATTDDSADEPDGSVTATVDSGSNYTVSSSQGAATVTVADDDPPPSSYTVDPQLIADVRSYAAEPHGHDHVRRWKRVLLALGDNVDMTGYSGGPTTLAEARQLAAIHVPARWNPVVAALEALEAASQTPVTPPPTVVPEVGITADGDVTEGAAASFTLSASPEPSADLSVSVTVSQDGDFGAQTGSRTVTIPTSGSVTLTIDTTNDSTDEPNGSVTVTLNSGSGYTVSSSQGAGTAAIADNDDPTPEVTVSAGNDITEGVAATFVISRGTAGTSALTVDLTVSDSGDFAGSGQTGTKQATIAAGDASTTLTVTTVDDTTDEADGSITVALIDGTDYDLGTPATATASVGVADDDAAPVAVPEVNITAFAGGPEGSDVTFTLTASAAPAADLAVGATVATSGDYGVAAGSRTVTIAAGTTSKTLTLPTDDDGADEADGSVSLTINSGNGYTVGQQSSATAPVQDDDAPPPVIPTVSITGGNGVTEGGNATFTVTATPAPATPLAVSVTVTAVGDFGARTGSRTVTIPTGGSATFTVATTDDSVDEADGSVTATLADGTGYDPGANKTATVSVADDDAPPPPDPVDPVDPVVQDCRGRPTVSVADATAKRGADLQFTISLSCRSQRDVTVYYAVAYDHDFDTVHILSIASGDTQATVNVPTAGVDESIEFHVVFTLNAANYAAEAEATITD